MVNYAYVMEMADICKKAKKMMIAQLNFNDNDIQTICRKFMIAKLALFGSVVRSDFGSSSDVDVLVQFGQSAKGSLFDLVNLQEDLVKIFGRSVHVVTYGSLKNPYFKKSVLEDEKVIYAEAG